MVCAAAAEAAANGYIGQGSRFSAALLHGRVCETGIICGRRSRGLFFLFLLDFLVL